MSSMQMIQEQSLGAIAYVNYIQSLNIIPSSDELDGVGAQLYSPRYGYGGTTCTGPRPLIMRGGYLYFDKILSTGFAYKSISASAF